VTDIEMLCTLGTQLVQLAVRAMLEDERCNEVY